MQRRLILYAGNLMAAVMDAGIGMLIAAMVGLYFGETLPWWGLLLGAAFALLPDIDLVPAVLWRGTFHFDHRQTPFHRPLLLIPLIAFITYLFGGLMWAMIALLGLLWHFLHDTNFLDDTYGVAWLWPFSDQFWSLRGSFPPPRPQPHEDWVKLNWLRPTSVSVRELGIGSATALAAAKLGGMSPTKEGVLLLIFVAIIVGIWWLAAYAREHLDQA